MWNKNIGKIIKKLHEMPHYKLFELNNKMKIVDSDERAMLSDKKIQLIMCCINDGRYIVNINDLVDPVSIKINLNGVIVGAVHIPMSIYNQSKINKTK